MVFRGSPVRRASSRSTGPEDAVEKAPEGLNPRRASARRSFGGSGRKLRHDERAAARTDSRREQSFEAGDPAVWSASPVTCAIVGCGVRGNSHDGPAVSVSAGRCVPSRRSRSWASCPRRGSGSSAQRKPTRRACGTAPGHDRGRTRREARAADEAVRLSGRGRLCRANPRDVSGTKQGRTATGQASSRADTGQPGSSGAAWLKPPRG